MKNKNLSESFKHAFEGIVYAIKKERNFKIHLCAALTVVIFSVILKVSAEEALILSITIALVLMAELFNTAIEAAVDLLCQNKKHRLAKIAKDCAAGAVLIAAVNSVIVGYMIFFHKLLAFLGL